MATKGRRGGGMVSSHNMGAVSTNIRALVQYLRRQTADVVTLNPFGILGMLSTTPAYL